MAIVLLLLLQGCSGVFFNKGENCIAAGRLFVEETVHDEYVERVVSLLSQCSAKPLLCLLLFVVP